MAEHPEKSLDVMRDIRRHLAAPGHSFSIGLHAADEAANDHITDVEIMQVLRKSGVHIPGRDEYSEAHEAWKYRIEGKTFEGRSIAVVVSFTPQPPLPLPALCVITVFDLRKRKK